MTAPQPPSDPLEDLVAECLRRHSLDGVLPLDELCAQHPQHAAALRERVRQLGQLGLAGKPAAAAPQQIGPYRILDVLGEGGMGTVYLAEQKAPVRRRVALKLIKLGMDSKAVVARFEQERQALALMQHDGIAKVFDCGISERGQPFFVMELVKGVPLTNYCDERRLSLDDRLALLQQVCAAVQHAHQKGVVHRDLKPGNVLVSDEGGRPQVKIIDFGLAKAMGQKLVEASLFTEAGQVVGTPEYMAPEQADPTNADIDTRADIYSLGVMLYEVLTGQLPFTGQELRRAGLLEMQRVLREVEPPKPSTKLSSLRGSATTVAAQRRTSAAALQRVLKNDLDWVVLKSLDKDRNRRYETANALAADLQRYLRHEPLAAGPPSAGYRLKKLVRRYRAQVVAGSLVLVALVGGGVATFVQYLRAEEKATENLRLAAAETQAKEAAVREQRRADDKATELAAKVREFDQLAGVVLYERAVANEQQLYPPWPQQVAAMETWLREDAGRLLAMRPEIERTLRDLERQALPATADERDADRQSHPRFADWELLGQRVASLRRAQAVRGGAVLVVPELSPQQQALTASALNALAWSLVAPKAEERKVYGEEPLGLAAARLAVQKAAGSANEYQLLDTLAWALLANGQDGAARQRSAEALAKAPAKAKDAYAGYQRDLDAAVDGALANLAQAEAALAELTSLLDTRRTFHFELGSQRFLHDTLAALLADLGSLESRQKPAVEQRLSWAKQIADLSQSHPNARHTWAAVRAALAKADDVVASRRYAGQSIALRDEDVLGLVPIGMNPATKLWEFYELRSAWDGTGDPRTLAIPEHRPDGSLAVDGSTGIVFVLLPGGRFTMGAQSDDPAGANYDPATRPEELPRHEVTLAPFFLGRFEVTRAQWTRLTATQPFWWSEGDRYDDDTIAIGATHPADSMSWEEADLWLTRNGLCLPTEAQWEYACRAGSQSPWWPGRDAGALQGCANVHDRTSLRLKSSWGTPAPIDDGFTAIAPVGSYRGNAFGLHDVHGNVREWCRDWFGGYEAGVRVGDGLREGGEASGFRVNRGGSSMFPATDARSAFRSRNPPALRSSELGVRAARPVRL